jgi:hypothetical protein
LKTTKRNVRVWFAVLLVSISIAALCAVWAVPPGGPAGSQTPGEVCLQRYFGCTSECKRELDGGWSTQKEYTACFNSCVNSYNACSKKGSPATSGAVAAPGQSQPPTKQGPNPTATPRKLPIKGPPHRLGPSPSPSATAEPILLAKPAKPTPTPGEQHNHRPHMRMGGHN